MTLYIVFHSLIEFLNTCLCDASLTFNSLPRSGNTPYWSLPTTLKPLTASVLAESPSVRISVHCLEFLPPASLASSSLGMPRILLCLLFWHFLLSCVWNRMKTQLCHDLHVICSSYREPCCSPETFAYSFRFSVYDSLTT